GGKRAGGTGCDATEIFQEGLRIPPLRLYAAGKPVEAVFELIDRNVRVARQVLGHVRPQGAACLTGERGYLALGEQYGADRFAACTTALLDQAERLARHAITAMPAGRYTFTDWMADGGTDPDPIPRPAPPRHARRPLPPPPLDGRRRHRSRPHPYHRDHHRDGRPPHRGFHRLPPPPPGARPPQPPPPPTHPPPP